MGETIDTRSLIELGINKYGTLTALSKKTKVNLATLRRIRNGHTKRPYVPTIHALIEAIR